MRIIFALSLLLVASVTGNRRIRNVHKPWVGQGFTNDVLIEKPFDTSSDFRVILLDDGSITPVDICISQNDYKITREPDSDALKLSFTVPSDYPSLDEEYGEFSVAIAFVLDVTSKEVIKDVDTGKSVQVVFFQNLEQDMYDLERDDCYLVLIPKKMKGKASKVRLFTEGYRIFEADDGKFGIVLNYPNSIENYLVGVIPENMISSTAWINRADGS